MKPIRLVLATLLLAVFPVFSFAQDSQLFHQREIVQLTNDDGDTNYVILAIDNDGASEYYLMLSGVGFGDAVLRVGDPLTNLFVKLGDTLEESQQTLNEFLDLLASEPGTYREMDAHFALATTDERPAEKIKVTSMKSIFGKYLEFGTESEGRVRAADIRRSELRSLLRSVKFYARIHPNEK
ncbi:MAG: hypothetical protein IJV37_05270 [Bacteroidales bacterium]|nr:hypothetical protein [Bacteroidales bacterium]